MNTWESEETPDDFDLEVDRPVSRNSITETAVYVVLTLIGTVYVGTGLVTWREVAGFALGIAATLGTTADLVDRIRRYRRTEQMRPAPRHRESSFRR